MKKQALYSLGLIVGAFALGCGGSGGVGTGPTLASFGSFSAELVGTAQPPVTSSAAYGANATGIAGAQFNSLTLRAMGENTLSDTKLVFASARDGNFEVYTMNPDGTGATRLTNSASSDYYPQYSRLSSRIAFTSFRDGNFEIYSMEANGTSQTRLTNNTSLDYEPSWSTAGENIVFTTDRDGNSEIYTMNSLGSGQVRRTNNSAIDLSPSWSPDGAKIAFASNRDGNYEIYTMNYDGTNPTRLTNNASGDDSPSWSPDGSKIVFTSDRDGNGEVYTMNADGTSQTRITNSIGNETDPSFSPDGSKIVFCSFRDSNSEIYVMNANGSSQTNITKLPSIIDQLPHWSGYFARTPNLLVGASAPFGTASAGFIFGQENDQVTSVLTFDTTTQTLAARSAARVTAQTAAETTGSNLIFSVTTTTGLGTMSYAKMNESGVPGTVQGFSMPTGTTAALVSFNSSTGLLSSIVPYTATRASLSMPTRSGNEMTFTGSFTQVLDAEGKVTVPNGASSITIDERTGKVVCFER